MMRPGISAEMLTIAGVRHVSANEAEAMCGEAKAGLWLPYRNADGGAIRDSDKDYGRLRLDQPKDKKKYHQAFGTTVHAYLPPKVADATSVGGDLIIIEGEFKSLSLTEAGFPAVGISGFYGFGLKDNGGLVPELTDDLKDRLRRHNAGEVPHKPNISHGGSKPPLHLATGSVHRLLRNT